MKRTSFLLLLALWAGTPLLRAGEDAPHRRTTLGKALVAAPRLRIRRTPAVSGALVGSVTDAAPLLLLDKSTFTAVIDERHAPWYRVRTLSGKYLEGWAFGGYLDVAPAPEMGVDPWLAALCYADIKVLGESREQAEAKLGPALSVQAREERNRHDDSQKDTARTLTFPKAKLRLYETPHKTFLEQTVITADVPGLNDLVKLGSSPRHVREVLGDPQRDDMKTMTYECSREQNDQMILSFTLDKLAAIEWSHYAD